MTRRPYWAASLAIMLLSGCVTRPSFLPAPTQAFDGFRAFDQPRPEAAVGALWIDGYGAASEPAGTDNLQTERSLSGLTIDSGFQATLSLGILKFLNLDPSLRNKFIARLNDVSIVRVKDLSKLAGPVGQPRLYEALKAASITITATREVGLDIQTTAAQQNLPVFGRSTSGRLSTFTIEAKDMFFAYRIARLVNIATKPVTMKIDHQGGGRVRLANLAIELTGQWASDKKAACSKLSLWVRAGSSMLIKGQEIKLDDAEVRIPLPIPVSDERGGLFKTIMIENGARPNAAFPCIRVGLVKLIGSRLEHVKN